MVSRVQRYFLELKDFSNTIDLNLPANYQILLDACPEKYKSRVNKFLSYAKNLQNNVPDPYYGGANGFDNVFDLVKEGCDYLFRDIEEHHL